MLLVKKGFPEEGELVLSTITKIQMNSVFVNLDEYNKSGMIHISEISPGRIRNIRDFVKEGKKVVCAVLRIHEDKGHIDLSLRRVNESQKKKKIEYIKQEQKAEKIIEFVAKNNNIPAEKVFSEVMSKLESDYDDLVDPFFDVVNSNLKLVDYGIDKKIAKDLEEVIRQRIKPPEVLIEGEFKIECYKDNGVEVIKEAFSKIDPNKAKTFYEGGGRYSISVKSSNYKDAEAILDELKESVTGFLEENDAVVSYTRKTKKK